MTTEQRASLLRDPNTVGECCYCAATITLADDGAWNDEAGACGCGAGEHGPGGYSEVAHAERAAETPWWDEHPGDVGRDYENLNDWS